MLNKVLSIAAYLFAMSASASMAMFGDEMKCSHHTGPEKNRMAIYANLPRKATKSVVYLGTAAPNISHSDGYGENADLAICKGRSTQSSVSFSGFSTRKEPSLPGRLYPNVQEEARESSEEEGLDVPE